MDKIEKARQLFQQLEENDVSYAHELSRRNFCIHERLLEIRSN
jgi:hypothetical protein